MNYKFLGWEHSKNKVYAVVEMDGLRCVLDSYTKSDGKMIYYDINRCIKYEFRYGDFVKLTKQ